MLWGYLDVYAIVMRYIKKGNGLQGSVLCARKVNALVESYLYN